MKQVGSPETVAVGTQGQGQRSETPLGVWPLRTERERGGRRGGKERSEGGAARSKMERGGEKVCPVGVHSGEQTGHPRPYCCHLRWWYKRTRGNKSEQSRESGLNKIQVGPPSKAGIVEDDGGERAGGDLQALR